MNAADPKVVQALQQATLLELFALSTLIDRLIGAVHAATIAVTKCHQACRFSLSTSAWKFRPSSAIRDSMSRT